MQPYLAISRSAEGVQNVYMQRKRIAEMTEFDSSSNCDEAVKAFRGNCEYKWPKIFTVTSKSTTEVRIHILKIKKNAAEL